MTSFRLQRRIGGYASPVTSGKRMFLDSSADGRSAWARRWNDLALRHAADLGGYETLSAAQISICKRAAAIEVELESLEGRMSAGQVIDFGVYARLVGCLCRLLELVGITRLARPMDPLSELAAALGPCPPTAPEDDESEA